MGCLLGHLGKCRQGTCLQAIWRLGSCHPGRCHQGRCRRGTCLQDTCLLGTCLLGTCLLAGICHWGTCLQDTCLLGTCLPGRCNGATCHQVWSCAKLSSNQGFLFLVNCCFHECFRFPVALKAWVYHLDQKLADPWWAAHCHHHQCLAVAVAVCHFHLDWGHPLCRSCRCQAHDRIMIRSNFRVWHRHNMSQHVRALHSYHWGMAPPPGSLDSEALAQMRTDNRGSIVVFRKFRKHQVQELNPSGCGPWGSSRSLRSTSKSKVQGLIPKSKNWQNIMA